MEPNLLVGDRLFVSKFSYGYSRHSFPFSPKFTDKRFIAKKPIRGDVIVFKTPADNRTDYIKRLIGLPGDTIQLIDSEISLLIKNAEKNATDIINTNINKLHDLSNALLDHETIDSNEFNDILENGYNPIEDQKSSSENKNTKHIDTPQD